MTTPLQRAGRWTPAGRPGTASAARAVAVLFLIATAAFFAAERLLTGALEGRDAGAARMGAAAGLAFLDGIAVVLIAVLLYPVLAAASRRGALAYLAFRIAELAVLVAYLAVPLLAATLAGGVRSGELSVGSAAGLRVLLQAQHTVAVSAVYLVTAAAGSTLAWVLHRGRLVPPALAAVGLVGYPVLFAGTLLALTGAGELGAGWDQLTVIPGGVFELLLPLWLLVRGLPTETGGPSWRADLYREG